MVSSSKSTTVKDLPQSRSDQAALSGVETPLKYPWRVVDARAFVHTGAIRMVLVEDICDLDVVAISYTWSDDMKKWRESICNPEGRTYEEKIGRGSRLLSASITASSDQSIARAHLFFTIIAFLVLSRGKKFFWMDIVCINQDKMQEKEFFVPQMGNLYRNTSETHAYPLGAEIATSVFSDQVYFPIWEMRAWTVQEQIVPNRLLYCYAFHGDAIDDIKKISHIPDADSDKEDVIHMQSLVLDKYKHVSGMFLLEKLGHTVTCCVREELPLSNLSMDAYMHHLEIHGDWSQLQTSIRRSSKHKVMCLARTSSKEKHAPEVARISLVTIGGRKSLWPQDMIYSVLAALGLENFKVTYDIGFEEARLRVFEALDSKVLAHILGTDWGSNRDSGNNDSALPRVVASSPTDGMYYLKSAVLHCEYTRSIGTQMHCRQERLRIWKASPDILQGLCVLRHLLGNGRILLMQGTSVFDTPDFASIPIATIPSHMTKVIIIDMSALGLDTMKDDDVFDENFGIDKIFEFVEIGECQTTAMLVDQMEINNKTSLLTLCCERTASGNLVNRGTALILDASALSTAYSHVIVQ